MKTRLLITIGIIIFISFTLVAVTNIENNQTLSERTSAEIYQDLLDSKAREKIIFTQAIDYKIHGESEINKAIEELENEIKLRIQLFDEYSNLPIEMQTEPGLDNEIFRMKKYNIILQGNDIEILEAQKKIERNFRITMERNGCDTCPIYSVSITGDGSVLYKGLQNVPELGKKEYSIPIDDVTELIRFFYTQNEGTLKTLYGSTESDDSVILTIDLGNIIRITHYGDAGPEFLKLLEDKIDETAKTEQFLKLLEDKIDETAKTEQFLNNLSFENPTDHLILIQFDPGDSEYKDLIPKEITIIMGDSVSWLNDDDILHSFSSDKDGDNAWSTGLLKPGESSSVTFNHTGVFEYHGEPGPWITGKIIVLEK